jgi:hypothetical protein
VNKAIRQQAKKTTSQEDNKPRRQQDKKMENSLARQAKIITWPPFFNVHQPIKRRHCCKTHRQLEENIHKNDGSGEQFNASLRLFYDGEGVHKHKLFSGFYCFLTCSSKKYSDPADERRNNFIKMTNPLITMPDADVMNIKCLHDSGLLMAHTAINRLFFFVVHFPWQMYWRAHQNF